MGNAVYALPFKQNTRIGGWQYGIIARAHSGNPFTVLDGFDRADLGDNGGIGNSTGGGERPNLVPGMSNNPKVGSVTEWYNPASFALQSPGSIGDLGRNSLVASRLHGFRYVARQGDPAYRTSGDADPVRSVQYFQPSGIWRFPIRHSTWVRRA